jgi:hypothetical protein
MATDQQTRIRPAVIHNYRWRLSLAKGEPQYDELERRLAAEPVITVPTITVSSDFDGPAKDGTGYDLESR